MEERNRNLEPKQDELEKALGYKKEEKPFWKRGFVYTDKPKKDVRLIQYVFLGTAGLVLIFAGVMIIKTLITMF